MFKKLGAAESRQYLGHCSEGKHTDWLTLLMKPD